jgi:hypothetical protein
VIFELEFLRYGKRDNRPVKIARMMEIASDVETLKARVRNFLGLWLGPMEQKPFASWIMRNTRSRCGVGAKMTPKL